MTRSMVPTIKVGVPRKISDRKGSRMGVFHPPIGEPFDFEEDEIADLNKAHPGAVRRPINESRMPTSDESGLDKGKVGTAETPLADGSGEQQSDGEGAAGEDDDL